jgi:hypothetical protein
MIQDLEQEYVYQKLAGELPTSYIFEQTKLPFGETAFGYDYAKRVYIEFDVVEPFEQWKTRFEHNN